MAILSTKLFCPSPRAGMIERRRLMEKIDQGVQTKLVLVSAPPGFGKTTLISGWVKESRLPVGWVSLDERDNDPTRFLEYLIAALQRITPGFGETIAQNLKSPKQPPLENVLTALINEISEELPSHVLVLDDFHVVSEPSVQEIMLFLLDHLPSQMHFIICTRANPPWPLARLRVNGEIAELHTADLRFTVEETTAFTRNMMGLSLTPEDVSILETRTEGWIASLQMVALSMQGRENPAEFIRGFSGSHRFIFDYLFEEVLIRQSPRVQEFILKTSPLERLCAPLCETLTGMEDSQDLIYHLEQANLFLVSLDDERQWFRYHHLFADLLRNRFQQVYPALEPSLHRKASDWYCANHYLPEAFHHALLAEDYQQVAQLVETDVLRILEQGELKRLLLQLDFLPDEAIAAYPWLSIASAWVCAQTGKFGEANHSLSLAQSSLADPSYLSADQVRHLKGHIQGIKAYIEVYSFKDFERASKLANQALAFLPEDDLSARGVVTVLLGTIQRLDSQLAPAMQTLYSALDIYHSVQHEHTVIDILGELARVHRDRGELNEAASVCKEAIQLASRYIRKGRHQIPAAAYVMGTLGRIYYEWNRLPDALEVAEQAIELSLRWGQLNTLLGNHLLLARIHRRQKNFDEATGAMQAAKELAEQISEVHAFFIQAHETMLHLDMGEIETVNQWVNQFSGQRLADEQKEELAPIFIALYQAGQMDSLDELLASLTQLQAFHLERQMADNWLKTTIQCAMAWQTIGNTPRAFAELSQVLSMGKAEGYSRSFLDQGRPMADLLSQAVKAGVEKNYASELLSLLSAEIVTLQAQLKGMPLVDPLTDREIEVLQLLSTGARIPDIAEMLVVSVSTVRTQQEGFGPGPGEADLRALTCGVGRIWRRDLARLEWAGPFTSPGNLPHSVRHM